jgi:hypothetical protein
MQSSLPFEGLWQQDVDITWKLSDILKTWDMMTKRNKLSIAIT